MSEQVRHLLGSAGSKRGATYINIEIHPEQKQPVSFKIIKKRSW